MKLSRSSRFMIWIATLFFTGLIVGGLALAVLLDYYSRDLPDYRQLAHYDPATVTRLYAGDGRLLAEYATEKRLYVPLDAIPNRVRQAFISAEDKNFYQHTGIDPTSILRAALTNFSNIASEDRSLVGGSTITQQVVKNFLLTNEKSLERKIREAILAFRISKAYSKDRILELYLNEIYLGSGSYGVAAAALNYFNRPLEQLSIAEAATLAALPKAPSAYSPRRNPQRARERRNWVIDRMLEEGYVTAEEAAQAKSSPVELRRRERAEVAQADFFAEEVRRWIAGQYGQDALYTEGLYVKTTVDPRLQAIADRSLRAALVEYDRRHGWRGPLGAVTGQTHWQRDLTRKEATGDVPVFGSQRLAVVRRLDGDGAQIGFSDGGTGRIPLEEMKWARRFISSTERGPAVTSPGQVLKTGDIVLTEPRRDDSGKKADGYRLLQVPKVNGAMVVIEPHTGNVLALSGGYSYQGSEFNRATQARRQPGSAFKPFVYLAALENGYTPATRILDAPVELSMGAGLPVWRPKNYSGDFLGPTTLRTGVEKSRNAMTVRLAQAIGINRLMEIGQRFGIYNELPRQFSIALGAQETTLLDLTNAYAILVNGGKRVTPSLVERIDDRNGVAIYRRDQRDCAGCTASPGRFAPENTPPVLPDSRSAVTDAQTAYQMVSILQGVVERGTAVRARKLERPLGGKTGTTNESRDTWFIGFSPDLVVGTYIGYDNPQPLGEKETGSSVALPAFISFMEAALKDEPAKPFPMPPGIQLVRIDRASGYPVYGDGPGSFYEAFKSGDTIAQGVIGLDPQGQPLNPGIPGMPSGYSPSAPMDPGLDPGYGYGDGIDEIPPYAPGTDIRQAPALQPIPQQPQQPQRQQLNPGRYAPVPARPLPQPQPGTTPRRQEDYGTGGLY